MGTSKKKTIETCGLFFKAFEMLGLVYGRSGDHEKKTAGMWGLQYRRL